MSKVHVGDESNTINQLKNPNPLNGNKTWLGYKANGESGLIDIMVLKGTYPIEMMIDELSKNPDLTEKNITQWKKRIEDHIVHLSSSEGDSRNRASGSGGHSLKIAISEESKEVFFNYES